MLGVLALVGLGVLLGYQYMHPDKRVLAVIAGLVLFGIAWRVDMVSGIGILALLLPFPRGTVFGSTNLAFVLLMLVISLLRVATRESPPPERTAADTPTLALFVAYVISFYNVADSYSLARGLERFEMIAGCMLMFFLVVNALRSERDFRRF